MRFKLIVGLILVAVVAVFVLQNTTVVEIRFLLWTIAMSRALLILLVLAVGITLGWLLRGHAGHRRRRTSATDASP